MSKRNIEAATLAGKINSLHEDGYKALHTAVENNDASQIEKLLSKGADIEVKNSQGFTPLLYAMVEFEANSHFDAIEVLLRNGADVNAQTSRGLTPLHYSASKLRTLRLLLKYEADVNSKDSLGKNPVFYALKARDFKNLRLLVDHGANVNNVSNWDETTPLHTASIHGANSKVVKFLVKKGADVNAVEFQKRTPLLYFLQLSFPHDLPTLKFLLKYSDINVIDFNKNHVLCSGFDLPKNVWKCLISHVAKLQALELTVNQKIIEEISYRPEYKDHFKRCTSELLMAKSTKLKNSWLSYFNLLVDCKRKLKNYAGNKDLVIDLIRSDLKKFPIYGALMKKNMNKGIKKRKLFDKSSISLSARVPVFNPNHLIIKDILDCMLSTKDLSALSF